MKLYFKINEMILIECSKCYYIFLESWLKYKIFDLGQKLYVHLFMDEWNILASKLLDMIHRRKAWLDPLITCKYSLRPKICCV
jgi:hypothetical protein